MKGSIHERLQYSWIVDVDDVVLAASKANGFGVLDGVDTMLLDRKSVV